MSYQIVDNGNQQAKSHIHAVDVNSENAILLDYWPSGISWDKVELPILNGYETVIWEDIPIAMPSHDIVIKAKVSNTTSILGIKDGNSLPINVYSLEGVKLCEISSLDELYERVQSGIYIVNGRKFVVK